MLDLSLVPFLPQRREGSLVTLIHSLIEANGRGQETLCLSISTFEFSGLNLTEENGRGVAINARCYVSGTLLIDAATIDEPENPFKRCGTSKVSGGSICLNAESGASLTFKSTTFKDCWGLKLTKVIASSSASYSSTVGWTQMEEDCWSTPTD